MSSQQEDTPPFVSLDGSRISTSETSIIVGVIVIALIIMIVMSITMNIWIRYKNMKVYLMSSRDSVCSDNSNDTIVSLSQATSRTLTKPSPIFSKETLPVYRSSDTWESYVKMIQTPEKLNDVVHSMKVNHTPSSSISTKVGQAPFDGVDNTYYTSDDYKLYRQSNLPKEYDDNNFFLKK